MIYQTRHGNKLLAFPSEQNSTGKNKKKNNNNIHSYNCLQFKYVQFKYGICLNSAAAGDYC